MGVDVGASDAPIVEEVPAEADAGMGFEALSGPRGVADDLKKLAGVSPAIEKKLNDLGIFHYWQIAAFTATAAHNVGEEVGLARPRRWLGCGSEGTQRRVTICAAVAIAARRRLAIPIYPHTHAGPEFASSRHAEGSETWRIFLRRWSRICARRPARA